MSLQDPDKASSTDTPAEDRSVATEVRERLEVARLVHRQRHVWQTLTVLAASAGLLLLAILLRRDQTVRDSATQEIKVVAQALDRWIQKNGFPFPADLKTVMGDRLPNVDGLYEYADAPRLNLARRWNAPVVVVASRKPIKVGLGQSGRAVVLCRRANFQAKWMTEGEFANQRRSEENMIAQSHSMPSARPGTNGNEGQE